MFLVLDEDFTKNFGEWVRKQRVEKQWSVERLSIETGLHPTTLTNIELGHNKEVKLSSIKKITEVFELEVQLHFSTLSGSEILDKMSPLAQICVRYIKNKPGCTNSCLVRFLKEEGYSLNSYLFRDLIDELKAVSNRGEILDSKDEPSRNRKGKLLRKYNVGSWYYDPVL